MANDAATIKLALPDLRAVAGYAAACARPALAIFERHRPDDPRPRAAIDAAQAFAGGSPRTKTLRDAAWAARRAERDGDAVASPFRSPFNIAAGARRQGRTRSRSEVYRYRVTIRR